MIVQIDEHYVPACGGGSCNGGSAACCVQNSSKGTLNHTRPAYSGSCSPASPTSTAPGSSSSPTLTGSHQGGPRDAPTDSSDEDFDPGLLQEGWQSEDSADFLEVEDAGGTEVVAVKEGVAVWPARDTRIMGRLSLVKQHNVLFLAWLPYTATPASPTQPLAAAAAAAGTAAAAAVGPRMGQSTAASAAPGAIPAASRGCSSSPHPGQRCQQLASEPPDGAAAAVAGGPVLCGSTGTAAAAAAGAAADWLYEDSPGVRGTPAAGTTGSAACSGAHHNHSSSDSSSDAGDCLVGRWFATAAGGQCSSALPAGTPPPAAAAAADGRPREGHHHHLQQQLQQPPPSCALPTSPSAAAAAAVGRSAHHVSAPADAAMYAIHPFPLSDVIAIRKHTPPLGWHYLVFVLVSGVTLPPLYFHQGGVRGLLRVLQHHILLVPCARDANTYLVNDTADPLRRSLTSLDLEDVLLGAPVPGASAALEPQEGPLANGGWMEPPPPVEMVWRGLGQQLGDTLSRVTALARESASVLVSAAVETWHADVLRPFDHDDDSCSEDGSGQEQRADGALRHGSGSSSAQGSSPSASAAAAGAGWSPKGGSRSCCAGDSGSPQQHHSQHPHHHQQQQQAAGWLHHSSTSPHSRADRQLSPVASTPPVVSEPVPIPGRTSASLVPSAAGDDPVTPLGSFELVEGVSEEDMGLANHHRVRPPPLSREEFATYFTPDGVLADEAGFRERVYYSGMDPELRCEGWQLLLGVYASSSSAAERAAAAAEGATRYHALKGQWRSIGREQAARFRQFRERKGRIEKDVRRTDRSQPFYRGADQERHLVAMRDILLTYAMYNFDLGYCQGMSDVLSPLLVVAGGDEAAAFWMFVALMRRLEPNFSADQQGMSAQLAALRRLVQVLDPQLHAFFESRDCLNYFFCFRWLLIHFKREFDFDRVPRLWEALWACPATRHLHLFLAAAVLVHHRRAILGTADMDFDGMLKFTVDLSGKLDMNVLLRLAEVLVRYAGLAGADICQGLP